MTTIHDPEELLCSLGERPVDHTALAAARADVDRRIAALLPLGAPPAGPRRRTRRVVTIAAAATVLVAAVVGVAVDRANQSPGAVVAGGAEGFAVPATDHVPFWCTERADHISYGDAATGGVAYLLGNAPDPWRITARDVTGCHASAEVASAVVRIEADGALTGAATLWGPNAVDPSRWLPDQGGTTSEVALSSGVTATMRIYDASAGDVGGLDGVAIVSWSAGADDWVLTTSGLDAGLTIGLASAATTGGPTAMGGLVPDFQDMTPAHIGGPSGPSWIAEYGTTEDFDSVLDPACAKTGCPIPSEPGVFPDHMTLEVVASGTERSFPWQVAASTRTLRNPYFNTTAVYRVVDVDGVPGLFKTAGETGLEGQVVWQVAPGVIASLRGTWGGSIEGVIGFVASIEPVTADDPRLPPPFDPDATP